MTALNCTHDPAARSWLDSANSQGSDFPIQNLPFGVFRRKGSAEDFRGGVAIGDTVVCLRSLAGSGAFQGEAQSALHACSETALNRFMAMGPAVWRALRHALFDGLHVGAAGPVRQALQAALVSQADAEHALPARVGNYTDFYTSIHHARTAGSFARPGSPLTPNFQWLPIAYHGRASTVVVNGTPFRRPWGQFLPPGEGQPVLQPSRRLDFELELATWVGRGNAQGDSIPLARANEHIFGYGLLNDWSARDIQFWESAPLGPFQGKNFCTTVSPWIVTGEALAPYRVPFTRAAGEPQPLPYLNDHTHSADGSLDIVLEAALATPAMRAARNSAVVLVQTNFRHQYWTTAQMFAHHTVGGCRMEPGDLLGSGTVSGPTAEEAGCLLELTRAGHEPLRLPGGEVRSFLEDGDEVILRAWCEKRGTARIGFGECGGRIEPALPAGR